MTIGSEFRFHGSISKPAERKPEMWHFQLKEGRDWVTLVTVNTPDKVTAHMEARGRDKKFWRVVDASKPASKPRSRKATAKPAESTEPS